VAPRARGRALAVISIFLDEFGHWTEPAGIMKSLCLLAVAMLLVIGPLASAQQSVVSVTGSPSAVISKKTVNYVVRVEWKDAKKGTNALQIVTGEGSFTLDTMSGAVKINDSDVPTTVKLQGTLAEVSPQKGRLQLFLGRTVPYVTGTTYSGAGGRPVSSYSQLSVGLNSTFVVTFGKPLVIQLDDNGAVSILVTREEN